MESTGEYLPLMEDRSEVIWAPKRQQSLLETLIPQLKSFAKAAETWHAGPSINMSAKPNVIFKDESGTFSWNVANSNCTTFSNTHSKSDLLTDTGNVSGTKPNGGGYGIGGGIHCGIKNGPGSWNVTPQWPFRQGHIRTYLNAKKPHRRKY